MHITRRTAGLVVLFLAAALLTGCLQAVLPKKKVTVGPPAGPGVTTTLSEQDLIRQAELAYNESKYTLALEKYQTFLKAYPNSAQVDMVLAAAGQIQETLDQNDQAVETYERLLKEHPGSKFSEEAGRRLAGLYLKTGRYDQAVKHLKGMLEQAKKGEDAAGLRILMGRALLGKKQHRGALDLFLRVYGETKDASYKDQARRYVLVTIVSMTPEELSQAQQEFGRDFPGGFIAYALAYRLYKAGKADEAKGQISILEELFPGHETIPAAKALRQAIEDQTEAPPLAIAGAEALPPEVKPSEKPKPEEPAGPKPEYKTMDIACVLPLTGRASHYGNLVLQGLQLAVKNHQPQTSGFKANLVILDSKSDPDQALELVVKAAAQDNLLAVVGPLLSTAALKAAPRAEELGLPLLTVTQKSGIPEMGRHVFRIFLTPQTQAEAVARYAVQILGFKNLAVLYPDEAYGQTMRDWFSAAVKQLGGSIVGAESYPTNERDFAPQIEKLAQVGKAVKMVGAGRKVSVHFEAVFLPDNYQAVAMIAPQFWYHDITTVRFLGTSLWHTPRLISTTARYVQRCVIPTGFYAGNERPEVKRFVELFRQAAGDEKAEPTEFEAYGYDAANLLLTMMDRNHVSTRKELVEALTKMEPFPGVTGRFSFDEKGEYKVEPMLITVEGTEFKPIE